MKKRIAAYATAAMLLGITLMVLPLSLKPSPFAPMGRYSGALSPFSSNRIDGLGVPTLSILSVATQPVNLLSLGGILSSGLIVALCVYVVLKRKTR
jgi:hypothetical protein